MYRLRGKTIKTVKFVFHNPYFVKDYPVDSLGLLQFRGKLMFTAIESVYFNNIDF